MLFALLIPLFLILKGVEGQGTCASAPTPSLRNICVQISSWDNNARAIPVAPKPETVAPGLPGSAGPLGAAPFPSTDFDCTTISCLCDFYNGNGGENCVLPSGQSYQKVLRKDFRAMTDDERQRYVNAMWTALSNGGYRNLSVIHSSVQLSPGAHSGPAFFPWHREFLKRMEITLRRIDPSVFIPYWDSTMDFRLPNPLDSVMWHPDLFGYESSDGQVRNGLFANWPYIDNSRSFRRQRAANGGSMFTPTDIATVMSTTDATQILANTAAKAGCPNPAAWSAFEFAHGNPHIWVGGDMLVIITSTNDPVFFSHHAMVDKVWEDWRQAMQSRAARTTQYPVDDIRCHGQAHFSTNTMQPFSPFVNLDGLSNDYTDSLYSYAPTPSCSSSNINGCGSRFLFCDLSHGNPGCAPKIVLGGNCGGFIYNEDTCYQGTCSRGVCVAGTTAQPTTQQPPSSTCLNLNYCCPIYAQTYCNVPSWASYMQATCAPSCGFCTGPRNWNGPRCVDLSPYCSAWAGSGYCSSYSSYMWENCKLSCNACGLLNYNTRSRYCGGFRRQGAATAPPKVSLLMDRGGQKKNAKAKAKKQQRAKGVKKGWGWARFM